MEANFELSGYYGAHSQGINMSTTPRRPASGTKKPSFKSFGKKPNQGSRHRSNSKMVYIGNLNYNIKEKDLVGIFGKFGKVGNVKLVIDLKTKKSKGIAFVEMFDADDMAKAIMSLNGKQIDGRVAKVSEAIPQK